MFFFQITLITERTSHCPVPTYNRTFTKWLVQ